DSAIIKIIPRQFCVPVSRQFRERFFRIVKAGFAHPRKQILNNLSNELKYNKGVVRFWLLKNNIQPTQRAETLTLEDWIKLTKTLNKYEG
ncbi:MAG: 16S rRNA (adenine(1518)-N(6)/adenine(1519)-N(6))-dimethyltransferase, partial [Candidatus Nealsonbacteria bacterium CG_4_8_14_3_um_filter_37_23]